MTTRKKTKEELKNQYEGFLEQEEKLGNITNEKKEEILGILSSDFTSISKRGRLKEKLSGTISDSEFEDLYGKYTNYGKDRIKKTKAILEEMKLLPEGYEFLENRLLTMILQDGNTVEEMEEYSKDDDKLIEIRNIIKHNISLLEKIPDMKQKHFIEMTDIIVNDSFSEKIETLINAGINKADDFVKLKEIIDGGYIANINVLIDAGIKDADDFEKLKDIICSGRRNNIETFAKAGIKDADDFVKLEEIIRFWNTDYIKFNVNALVKAGIKDADDFVKLTEIIHSRYTEDIASNIDALSKAGIKKADDFMKLKDVVLSGNTDRVKSNIEMLSKVGIKDADDFVKLNSIICSGHQDNIEILEKIGIKDVDDFVKLTNIICSFKTNFIKKNLETFVKAGIKDTDGLAKLTDIIRSEYTEDIASNVETLSKAGITKAEDFAKLSEIILSWNTNYIKANIDTLVNIGIKDADDFAKLTGVICSGNTNDIKSNIESLVKAGIKDADGLAKLTDIIRSGSVDRIKDNTEVLVNVGIKEADDFEKMTDIIRGGYMDNILALIKAGIKDVDDLVKLKEVICFGCTDNLEAFVEVGIKDVDDFLKLKEIIHSGYANNIKTLVNIGIKSVNDFLKLKEIINSGYTDNVSENIETLVSLGIRGADELFEMQDVICQGYPDHVKINIEALQNVGIEEVGSFVKLKDIIFLGYNVKYNMEILKKYGLINGVDDLISLKDIIIKANPDNLDIILENIKIKQKDLIEYKDFFCCDCYLPNINFKDDNHEGYLKYFNEVVGFKSVFSQTEIRDIILDISKLSLGDVENFLDNLKEFCIKQRHHYYEFLQCFDGKSINSTAVKFLGRGFDISGPKDTEDVKVLNSSINKLYPQLNIKFNEVETKKILGFIDSIGGINKGYTILILTIEKMVRDGLNGSDFNRILFEKLESYKKIIDMYPEDKIPDGLKISMGLEFEMTQLYSSRFNETTGNNYHHVADNIVRNAKVGIENEGVYEFATKPSTNPMVALLEIHLLQELNLLDINHMQKLGRDSNNASYSCRNGTGYHLNIGSDSDIGVDDNIHFIQNLCTIIPRAGISNGEDVSKINRYNDINSKSGFSIFSDSKSTKYIELRTYSVDDVELFEKNVLFNAYAIMGSQAQKKVSSIKPETIYELKNNDNINDSDDLMQYLEDNNLFNENQDTKSKRIASEFIFMQIAVLRSISNYNQNFINDELFGINEISNNLNDSWKNYFIDLLCLDGEQIGYIDDGHSSRFVKYKCKKLYNAFKDGSFNLKKYLEKSEPFSDEEAKKILEEYGESFDESIIHRITIRLNKRLLWEKLIISCDDTQNLENLIKEKKGNINRIKNSIRGMDQNLKIDRQYLQDYFKGNMSLIQYNPYRRIDVSFMNKIIHLNNFFLKKDDTNANGVLKKTVFEGGEEPDISQSSIFETGGYMRKGYNYYQGGTENMLLHKTQEIAIDYMENVRRILNTNYMDDTKKTTLNKAA